MLSEEILRSSRSFWERSLLLQKWYGEQQSIVAGVVKHFFPTPPPTIVRTYIHGQEAKFIIDKDGKKFEYTTRLSLSRGLRARERSKEIDL